MINRHFAFAMRCIGCTFGDSETLCGIMDLPPPVRKSSQLAINNTIHKAATTVPPDVMTAIKPIFNDLSKPELLQRCLQGCTQNANESLNSTIWKYCTKKKSHGLKSVETATAIAVSLFNNGATVLCEIMQQMGIEPGQFSLDFCARKDSMRIRNAQRMALFATKEARQARRRARLQADETSAQKEGQPYSTGAY